MTLFAGDFAEVVLDNGVTVENPVNIEYIPFLVENDLVIVSWVDEEGFIQRTTSKVCGTRFIRKEEF